MEKRTLDEETKKALQGYAPFSTDAVINFTPIQWPKVDLDFIPVFHLRSFSQSETSQLRMNYRKLSDKPTDDEYAAVSDANLQLVRKCVVGWENLFDAGTGMEILYKEDSDKGCDKDLWVRLPVWLVRVLLEGVRKISGLTPIDELGLR